ncbi:MAG: hypothetical protein KAJ18_11335, partial [Candidatus Omnitrophica bacterium]|nr:hypothetical protein [Candidatus Omnitrophota bacterium]
TGWEIEGRMDPAIYEKIRNTDLDEQEILLTTTVRNFPLLLGVKYGKMNIYIRSKKDISEVEIRYLAETSMFFRSFKSYKNKRIADQIFTHIERVLEK